MSEIKKQWYVIRAVGGKEAKVKEYIEAEVRHNHLEDYISQVLIPTEKVYTIRNGKKISKEKVSYPGYVLVEAAFVGQIPIMLRNTPNVLGFLGDTKEESRKMIATPLRPQEVARILGRVDEMSVMEEENEIPFFVGETVKVTDGPFLELPRYYRGSRQRAQETHGIGEDIRAQNSYGVEFHSSRKRIN